MRGDRIYLVTVTLAGFAAALLTVQVIVQWVERDGERPGLWGVAFANHDDSSSSNLAVKEQETIRKAFTTSCSPTSLLMSIFQKTGSIFPAENSAQIIPNIARVTKGKSREPAESICRFSASAATATSGSMNPIPVLHRVRA